MKLQKIIEVIETITPVQDACEWDNVGLMIGLRDSEITKAVVSLDFDDNALNYAIENNAELIITHHPAIFRPLKNITDELIIRAIKNNISVYSAHTNFDAAEGGVNYALADRIGMYNCTQYGMLRVGYIDQDSFKNVIQNVKINLDVSGLRVVGDLDKQIRKVAVLGGAGGDFISESCQLGCDLFITGECKYDQAQTAYKNGIAVIAAGHFETENPSVHRLTEMLKKRIDIDIEEVPSKNIYKIL